MGDLLYQIVIWSSLSEANPCILQISMKKLLSRGTILVGHSLYNDLEGIMLSSFFGWVNDDRI
jgi:hypothetical protein